MKKTSKHINIIVKSLFVVIFLIIAFFVVLAHGISIRKLEILNLQISEFYLKLDKKLILNASEVYIKKANNTKPLSINQMRQKIVKLKEYKQFLSLFQNINIKAININNTNKIRLYYDQKNLNIISDELEANLNINPFLNELLVNITSLRYKDLSFYGEARIAKNIQINGFLHSLSNDLSAKLNILNQKNDFSLDIENVKIKNQERALAHISTFLKPKLREWLLDRVKFQRFEGSFAFHIKNNKLVKSLGSGEFSVVNARFNDNAPIASAKNIRLELNDFALRLESETVGAPNVNIDKFILEIPDLLSPNINISLSAKKLLYNDTIEKIINAYKVNLGLRQTSGESNAKVQIHLKPAHQHDILVDVNTSGGYVYKDFAFNAKASVKVTNNSVQVQADASAPDIVANGAKFSLDLTSKIANLDIARLKINKQDYFAYDDSARARIDFANKSMSALNSQIKFGEQIEISSKIKDILPFSKKLRELKFSEGDLKITSKNGELNINILNAAFDLGLFKNTEPVSKYDSDDFYIKIINNETFINTKSTLISLNTKQNSTTINAHDITIDLSDYESSSNSGTLNLNLKNSLISYKEHRLELDTLSLHKNAEQSIVKARFKHGGELSAKLGKNEFIAYLRKVNHKSLNALANKQVFISGEVDIDAKGKDLREFDALINIRESYLANTKNYINLIAFIESVPSIMTLHKPGFTKKGLGIKFGSIELKNRGDLLNISDINILGYSIDCNGSGVINTKSKTADITLNIFTLKNTNKIISNIPIVKQIFIGGKDNKIATQLKITGNVDNLSFRTSLAKDIITSPFVLIKNIVSLPKTLIGK